MKKRLFTLDARAESILSYKKNNNQNLSQYVSGSILDSMLPVYSRLRIEALFLLDYVVDGNKNWAGNRLTFANIADETDTYIRQTIGRGLEWIRDGHHIRDCRAIRDIIYHYCIDSASGGVSESDLNLFVQSNIRQSMKLLSEIDADYVYAGYGLGRTGIDILQHWEQLWDCDWAYDLLMNVVYCEHISIPIDPYKAIKFLQDIESQFIIQSIGT